MMAKNRSIRNFFQNLSSFYTNLSLILINSIIFILILEGMAFLWITVRNQGGSQAAENWSVISNHLEQYYQNKPGFEQFPFLWYQFEGTSFLYSPFTVWETKNYKQPGITSVDGFRVTPHKGIPADDTTQIMFFGGSTMWGSGVPDSMTIPACAVDILTPSHAARSPVHVQNYGMRGYVFTQELIQLIKCLQRGDIPDWAIFYHGVNDAYFTYLNKTPYQHYDYEKFEQTYNSYAFDPNLFVLLKSLLAKTNIGSLIFNQANANQDLYKNSTIEEENENIEKLVTLYEKNYHIIQGIADEYGFQARFFLQPQLLQGKQPRSGFAGKVAQLFAEELSRKQSDPNHAVSFINRAYRSIHLQMKDKPHFYDLSDIFDTVNEEPIYMDICHLSPEGNYLVAKKILDICQTYPQ